MDEQRRAQLKHSLEDELADKLPRSPVNDFGRLSWLSERTIEYLDRWLAFCRVSSVTPANGIDSVLFDAVEIAASVTSAEVARMQVPDAHIRLWENCATALSAARSEPSDHAIEHLRRSLSNWRDDLSQLVVRGQR
jgi:hypothetical protein